MASFVSADVRIGESVPDFKFTDTSYNSRSWSEVAAKKPILLVLTSLRCSEVPKIVSELNELVSTYGARVTFLGINVDPRDDIQDIALQAIELKLKFPLVKDFQGRAAAILGASKTSEVFLLDSVGVLRYCGCVQDSSSAENRFPLRTALEKFVSHQEIHIKETVARGSPIPEFKPEQGDPALNFAEHIAPILNRHCVECHQAGTEAPFALTSYESVVSKSAMIAEVVKTGQMPPWFAHGKFGEFKNERRLTPEERRKIQAWHHSGSKPGDLTKVPPAPSPKQHGWTIGEPDLIIAAEKEEIIPAEGPIAYRYVELPYQFEADTWVQAVEILPSNIRVVHHANLALRLAPGQKDESEGFSGFITGRVPGGHALTLTNGIARRIPKNAKLWLQLHYITTGKEERDRISVGLRYAREPIRKKLRCFMMENHDLLIPPHAYAHPVVSTYRLECDATAVEVLCHTHLRGRDSTLTARLPTGEIRKLLVVPNYNFDWQLTYKWAENSVVLPRKTVLEFTSHFDNSRFNPFNPDPSREVRWGEQTEDEMNAAPFFYTDNAEELNIKVDPATGREWASPL